MTVLNVDPAGETTVLFPNRFQTDNFVPAGRVLQVPYRTAGLRIVVSGGVGAELLKVLASTEPISLFDARQLADAGPFQMVRVRPERLARSLTVVMSDTDRPSSGAQTAGAAVALASSSTEWAVCHQTISTVPTLSAAARRTRSLTVQRTQDSGGSVTCEETR